MRRKLNAFKKSKATETINILLCPQDTNKLSWGVKASHGRNRYAGRLEEHVTWKFSYEAMPGSVKECSEVVCLLGVVGAWCLVLWRHQLMELKTRDTELRMDDFFFFK